MMQKSILEASRHLPASSPEGTILKIPISEETGQFIESEIPDADSTIIFYCFLKNDVEWVFLGRGLTA